MRKLQIYCLARAGTNQTFLYTFYKKFDKFLRVSNHYMKIYKIVLKEISIVSIHCWILRKGKWIFYFLLTLEISRIHWGFSSQSGCPAQPDLISIQNTKLQPSDIKFTIVLYRRGGQQNWSFGRIWKNCTI